MWARNISVMTKEWLAESTEIYLEKRESENEVEGNDDDPLLNRKIAKCC